MPCSTELLDVYRGRMSRFSSSLRAFRICHSSGTHTIVGCLHEEIPWPVSVATFPRKRPRKIVPITCLKKNQSTPRPSEHPPVMLSIAKIKDELDGAPPETLNGNAYKILSNA
ncbi:unnamed protein product [Ascophyllum nodosum]